MADGRLANWEERVRTIASNLLTLEVNTVLKNGMVAQKMPEVPLALHAIVQDYAGYILGPDDPGLPAALLAAAAGRLANTGAGSAAYRKAMGAWAHEGAPLDIAGPMTAAAAVRREDLTNGAETFEALLWAASAARHAMTRAELGRNDVSEARRQANQRRAAVLTRIEDNSRQLREAAIVMEQAFSSAPDAAARQQDTTAYRERLERVRTAGPAPQDAASRLFGATLDQTTQALFVHPRPVLNIDPDLTVLVRKAWDISVEEVMFQTVVQVDGDVLVRVADMAQPADGLMATLHRNAVKDALAQWNLLFKVAGDLIGAAGAFLFGGRSPAAPAAEAAPAPDKPGG